MQRELISPRIAHLSSVNHAVDVKSCVVREYQVGLTLLKEVYHLADRPFRYVLPVEHVNPAQYLLRQRLLHKQVSDFKYSRQTFVTDKLVSRYVIRFAIVELHYDLDNFDDIAKRLACQEPYCGEWDSEEDFARHIVEECYDLERTMGGLSNNFDYEAFGRELFMYDYTMGANNNVFRNICPLPILSPSKGFPERKGSWIIL